MQSWDQHGRHSTQDTSQTAAWRAPQDATRSSQTEVPGVAGMRHPATMFFIAVLPLVSSRGYSQSIPESIPESIPLVSSRCGSDRDCSLNGRCHNATCRCLAAWTGTHCAKLSLLPAQKGAGLHAPHSSDPNSSSWGGSVGYDPVSKRWQMFAAEMVGGCGIGSWEQNSRIVRASSDTPGGEYLVEEQIKPPFAHEPVLQRLADGRWLLYSIGNVSSAKPPRTDCRGGYSPAHTGNAFISAIPDEIYISDGPGLQANWTRVPVDINPQLGHPGQHGDGGDINPAPLVFENGSVVMMWRGGDHWYDVHLAHSRNWSRGPYTSSLTGSCFTNINTKTHGVEDPFLYRQPWPDGEPGEHSYHAIFHDHSTFGGHAYSEDGVNWTYSLEVPFSNEVNYTDGDRVLLQRRERPHLIFDSAGYITHLTNGVQPPPTASRGPPQGYQNDYTYTLVQPVAQQRKQQRP